MPGPGTEFDIIGRCFAPLADGALGAASLTDDVATLAPAPGHDHAFTVDTLVAGTHFFAEDDPRDIARKLLRVNLSDLAASGAQPVGYFLSLSLPSDIGEGWIEAFAAGLADDQDAFGISLMGGDTTSTKGPVSLSVTAVGQVPTGKTVRRSGAQAGDRVLVTGTVGDGALGLDMLKKLGRADAGAKYPFLVDRFLLPQPRTALAVMLRDYASAAIDISDGLIADAGHIADVSEVAIEIDVAQLPLSDAARALLAESGEAENLILGGGDDYEILFTVSPDKVPEIMAGCTGPGVPITEIGFVSEGTPKITLVRNGEKMPVPDMTGWRHF